MPIATLVCTLLAYTGPGIDIQVDGAGLMRFARSGRAVFAKKARLAVTAGHLTSAGCDLLPPVTVPNDAVSIDVDLEGNLYAIKTSGKAKIGKLVLAMFGNEDSLTADGKFLIAQDRPTLGEAGQSLFGVIRHEGGDSKPALNVLDPISPIKSPVAQPPGPSSRPSPRIDDRDSAASLRWEEPALAALTHTGIPLDIAILGDGFFKLLMPNGEDAFTRAGKFRLDANGLIVTVDGYHLNPEMSVPAGATSISVKPDGSVSAVLPGSSNPTTLGVVTLTHFKRPASLTRIGENLFTANDLSGRGFDGAPGENGTGTLASGFLEKLSGHAAEESVHNSLGDRATIQKPTTKVAPYRSNQKIKGERPVISIRLDNEAKGDKILLGEIADVSADPQSKASLEAAQIGDTPSLGVERGIDAFTITAGLSRAGWKIGSYVLNMTQGAKVRRQCQQIEDEKFVQLALEAAKSQLKMLVPLHSDIAQPPFSAPLGEVSLKVESCKKVSSGVNASVALYVDGHRLNSRMIQLSPDKEAVEVTQGQVVKIVAHAAGATVQLSGKAKGQAWAGQQVTVETETGAVLIGTVNQDGNVEVSL